MSTKTAEMLKYKVKDMALAEWGRKEIEPVSYTHLDVYKSQPQHHFSDTCVAHLALGYVAVETWSHV